MIGIKASVKDGSAQVFCSSTYANITNNTQKFCIQFLAKNLKGYRLWSKIDAEYPMIGGTSTSHRYNLKNVNFYQITWFGTVTHNSNGITGNGVDGYGNTGWVPVNNDVHLSLINRTATPTGLTMATLEIPAGVPYQYILEPLFGGTSRNILGDNATNADYVPSSAVGAFDVSRLSSTSLKSYRNNIVQITNTTLNSNYVMASPMFLLARNLGAAGTFATHNIHSISLGKGFTDEDVVNRNNIYSYINGILGRT